MNTVNHITIPSPTLTDFAGWINPTLQFTSALLRASLRNKKALAITLGMPLFMLGSFWIPSLGGTQEDKDLMNLMFPAVVILSVIMPGLTQATRLTMWREQNIFQRFALTPVPLVNLMFGAGLSQIVIGLGQGMLTLLFGVLVVKLTIDWLGSLLVLVVMVFAAAAFVAFGSFIAALNRKSDIAGYAYFFTMMPLVFLASFPPEMMPDSINAFTVWLPTSMAIELIGAIFFTGHLPSDALFHILGLLVYTLLFTVLSTRVFRGDM